MSSRLRKALPYIALAALVGLNAVLIGMLLTRDYAAGSDTPDTSASPTGDPFPESVTDPVETTPPAGESETEAPDESATEDDVAAPAPVPAERLIANANADIAWRANVGSCEAPGVVEGTTDGGNTWQPAPLDLAPVSRVKVLTPATVFAIGGTDPDCVPTYVSTVTGGAEWSENPLLTDGSWYVHPSTLGVIGTGIGEIESPCEVAGLAGFDDTNAALLCTDGSLQTSADAGFTWSTAAEETGAVAIGLTLDGYVLAGTDDSCEGIAISTAGVDGAIGLIGCVAGVEPEPGQLAVSGAGQWVWLWAGDETLVSADGGATW